MTDVLVAALGSGVLVAIINNVFSAVMAEKKNGSGIAAGTRIMLYDRIKYLGRKHISRGNISSEDLHDIIEMHRIYHDELGGNGFLDEIMERVKSLPIKD